MSRGPVRLALLATLALASSCAHDELSTGVWVHDLEIKGTKEISKGDLEDALATKETGWWPFASKKWFDEAAFDLDLQRIKAFYADHGFFDARVVTHEIKRGDKGRVDVTVEVQENSPTRISAVRFSGFPTNLEAAAHKEASNGQVVVGRLFDYADYAALKARLADRLHEEGYAYAQIGGGVDVDRDKHTAAVHFEAQPGPLVRFGQTTVEGNAGIPAWKLLNRVAWKPGDPFDPGDVGTTQGRLYDLGVFSSVRLELPPEPTPTADVKIAVKPGKLYELRTGGGVGVELQREEVRARAELTINNFLGGLRKLRVRLKPAYVVLPSITNIQRSGLAAQNDIQLTQPDVFGSNATVHALAGYDVGIAEGYRNHGPRTQLGIDRPFFRNRVLAGASWNFQYLKFFEVEESVFNGATQEFYGFVNPYRLAYLEEFAQVDLRNRPLSPTFGGYFILHLEQGNPAVGGAFSYLKVTPDVRLYAPLHRRVVVAVRGMLGWLRPMGDSESPITRRYVLGGPSSHRGFGFGRLSALQPLDAEGRRIPVGGDGAVLLSGELRIDVMKIAGAWLGAVPFVDAGDVVTEFSRLSPSRLNVATGLSLEYTTPIGIIRGGVGVRLNRLEGPDVADPGQRFAFHITIGEAF